MAPATHVLYESASGYALFEAKIVEEIGTKEKDVQKSYQDLHKFGKMVQLKSFVPFKSAAHALENINDVSEGIMNDYLKSMLELNLSSSSKSSSKKSSSYILGVEDKNLATSIQSSSLGLTCDCSQRSLELIRGIRLHAEKLLGAGITGFQAGDMAKAQLGLGHSYSRSKVKFNVNRSDNMIIQAIALLDQLDKDVNTFSMRIREWYGYTFPELGRLIPDNLLFARLAKFVGNKASLDESKLEELAELVEGNETLAKNILDAARTSMGTDLNDLDAININNFATRVVGLAEYRLKLVNYLADKMGVVAPSLTALVGERIGARLISHAGSLTNLSKYPASTVQILGAEKALFRALKTKGNTPKYGLIYHSTFIGRAGSKHKGRISRFLANKCSIASRIDCYSDNPTSKFGDALRNQVEERLNFFETGTAPSKNSDTMKRVLDALAMEEDDDDDDESDVEMADGSKVPVVSSPVKVVEVKLKKEKEKEKSKEKVKEKHTSKSKDIDGGAEAEASKEKEGGKKHKDKKDKKDKKRKAEAMDVDVDEAPLATTAAPAASTNGHSDTKSKSKSKSKAGDNEDVDSEDVAAAEKAARKAAKKAEKAKRVKEEAEAEVVSLVVEKPAKEKSKKHKSGDAEGGEREHKKRKKSTSD